MDILIINMNLVLNPLKHYRKQINFTHKRNAKLMQKILVRVDLRDE